MPSDSLLRMARLRTSLAISDAADEKVEETAPLAAHSDTVLVVEDEEAVRRLTKRILEDHGYTVLDAPSGQEAIDIVDTHPGNINLLLTDVVMPEMGGKELADRLSEELIGLKVLFMSGYPTDTIAQHGILDEDVPLLHKPFTSEKLLTRIDEILTPSAP